MRDRDNRNRRLHPVLRCDERREQTADAKAGHRCDSRRKQRHNADGKLEHHIHTTLEYEQLRR